MVSQFPLYLIATLSVLGLAPFVLMMITSYAKIIIVTTLVRNALGVQQVPPAMVMNGLAIILTVFIMAPVAMDTYDIVKNIKVQTSITIADAVNIADQASPPLRKFSAIFCVRWNAPLKPVVISASFTRTTISPRRKMRKCTWSCSPLPKAAVSKSQLKTCGTGITKRDIPPLLPAPPVKASVSMWMQWAILSL